MSHVSSVQFLEEAKGVYPNAQRVLLPAYRTPGADGCVARLQWMTGGYTSLTPPHLPSVSARSAVIAEARWGCLARGLQGPVSDRREAPDGASNLVEGDER